MIGDVHDIIGFNQMVTYCIFEKKIENEIPKLIAPSRLLRQTDLID